MFVETRISVVSCATSSSSRTLSGSLESTGDGSVISSGTSVFSISTLVSGSSSTSVFSIRVVSFGSSSTLSFSVGLDLPLSVVLGVSTPIGSPYKATNQICMHHE